VVAWAEGGEDLRSVKIAAVSPAPLHYLWGMLTLLAVRRLPVPTSKFLIFFYPPSQPQNLLVFMAARRQRQRQQQQ
jgi:hypothetical protein